MDADPEEVETQRVGDAIRHVITGSRSRGQASDGVPLGLVAGYLGMLARAERYELYYDPELLEPGRLREQIRAKIGTTADLVEFVPSSRSARDLAEVLRKLHRREWDSAAKRTGYQFHLNMQDSVVDIWVDPGEAPAELLFALEALGPDLVRVSADRPRGRACCGC